MVLLSLLNLEFVPEYIWILITRWCIFLNIIKCFQLILRRKMYLLYSRARKNVLEVSLPSIVLGPSILIGLKTLLAHFK